MPRRRADTLDRLIGANIRRLRLDSDVSQPALAKILGVSQQQVRKYEAGTSPITASSLIQIALALGVPLDRLWQDIIAGSSY